MKKIKIGVMGVRRGESMIHFCKSSEYVNLVAICDKWERRLEKVRKKFVGEEFAYYTDFDKFIRHDMDAVVLANYANEHAPYAIKALKSGKHVFSEVLPAQTMKEAVELIEAVEGTGKIYAYGENYCYMPAVYEMRKLYRAGKIGEFEYGEGEYIHNCESIWPNITYGDREHWRNHMYANFYCTHSIGPLIHITGLRPVSVVGFEGGMLERHLRVGAMGGQFGIEMITLENGGIIKSIHGDLYKNSVWYSVYGSKGRMESAREDAKAGGIKTIYVNADRYPREYGEEHLRVYQPDAGVPKSSEVIGHGGSDFCSMNHFIKKILGDEDADTIDVYEAMDMFLPGMFAYRSFLNGGIPMEIPNLRDKSVREFYREDTMCVDPETAGDMLIPSFSEGNPEIDDKVYEVMKQKWLNKPKEKREKTVDDFNVCRFVPVERMPEQIHIINFVYETKYSNKSENKIDTSYKMAYVAEGSCVITCRGRKETVKKGDVFFVFPSVPYTMTGDESFKFIYISYIGVQANVIMEKLHITAQNFVFRGYEESHALWIDAVLKCDSLPELAAEGVLLYMFSKIGSDVLRQEKKVNVTDIVYKMQMVKKYIDDHFSDSSLSLETISHEFSYNKKYLSSAFKQQFKVGISEYLTTVRINHACVLMEQNYTSVKDIAFLCGFSEQMYFSRVFRKKMGVSPREHMKTLS